MIGPNVEQVSSIATQWNYQIRAGMGLFFLQGESFLLNPSNKFNKIYLFTRQIKTVGFQATTVVKAMLTEIGSYLPK